MNQGTLDVVKQEMARVNIDILISELKWVGMDEFNSGDHYIYYHGQESLRRNGVVLKVNKRVWNAVLGCSLKNDRKISVHFQDKPFSIKIIQIYAPTTNAREEQDLPELTTTTKKVLFIIGVVVQSLSRVWLVCDPMDWSTDSLSFNISQNLLKLMPIELVMPRKCLILRHPLLLLPSVFPSIRVFSNESALCIRWPKHWRFNFSSSPSTEYSWLISCQIDWFYVLAVQETLKSLLQYHSSKVTILRCSAYFIVQVLHPYMTTRKTIILTRWAFVQSFQWIFQDWFPLGLTALISCCPSDSQESSPTPQF